ncbi:MAG: Nudix family hydrolase [Betaproteobacteria bacterium]|nr:Nudix family hydrolase [Betaproteobacteria bacterium]MDH3436854.1 Nudix family hydrolase [Betaproteobacteria bacterium]
MSAQRIEVAAAVVLREDGSFLLGRRPAGKVYAGYWEFPGGKVETGELPPAALTRELHEELGIDVELGYPWLTRDYEYEHAAVRLRFFRVVRWSGSLRGRENQIFSWQLPDAVQVAPLLPANAPILRALRLPPVYGISHASDLGQEGFVRRLEQALADGLGLFQVREKEMPEEELARFLARVMRLAHGYGARVLLNGNVELAQRAGADGVHLTAGQLMRLDRRPGLELVGASCHDERELARAAAMGADFVVLGPVSATPSHPKAPGMGWDRFANLIVDYPLPVYALGGLNRSDIETAWRAGAHGVSMMRGAWS